jgi:hypothetical protein
MSWLMGWLGWLAEIDFGLLLVALLLLLLAAKEIGYAIGRRAYASRERRRAAGEVLDQKEGVGLVTGGMLALMAFLLALSVSMAQGRYDSRREAVRNEANAIGTAWLRADFAGPAAPPMRAMLREYADHRLQAVRTPPRRDALAADVARTNDLQNRIWAIAADSAINRHTPEVALLIEAVNEMFDLSLTSRRAFTDRVPIGVLRMLLWATLISVGVIGYNFAMAGTRHFVFSALLLVFWSSSLVLIVDLNDPTKGAIAVDPAPLVWTIEGFGPAPAAR